VSSEQQPQPNVGSEQEGPGGPTSQAQPSEDELRAAYEAELNRITAAEMIIQTAVSLINIAGRRLGLAPSAAGGDPSATPGSERDLEQVRDAIDGASALMPILERRMPGELAPLRDAIAQLQVAYAREAQSVASTSTSTSSTSTGTSPAAQANVAKDPEKPAEADPRSGAGPAQASGRLWVPGR
jgi:hypothetical protein